ncbi:MAG TPA: sarcosine oxidase subunit alpha family protein [Steroidobacteraceae bacterium]|nr:sarcosine oxidase subunit alpha family protein [Steroidobacteraceae bacterium]
MPGPFRLREGGHIDRTRSLRFTFDGRPLGGFEGDTIASALLANGISVVGRGMKFHRPRGVLSAGVEEPNALITVGSGARREPSVRATVEPLVDGLIAASQNRWPSVNFDFGRVNDLFHRLLPAGFYNKTFMWPNWHLFEPAIRRMAGLGVAPSEPDPDHYEWRNAHCDVLVIGGGAAGLLAAFMAGRSGARVLLLESDRALGGGLNWERGSLGHITPDFRVRHASQDLSALPQMRVLMNTTAVGAYDHEVVTAVQRSLPSDRARWRQRWWRIRAKRIVLATGAFEQPLVFPFNDRPGIMLAGAIRHYLNRYAVSAGQRVALATNNDSAYQVAFDLKAAGVPIPCLLDSRPRPSAELVRAASSAGIEVHSDARITATRGGSRIESLRFSAGGMPQREIACDALGMSGGWNPVAHLYCQAGGRLRFDANAACLVPDEKLESFCAVGAAAGVFTLNTAMAQVTSAMGALLKTMNLSGSTSIPEWADYPHLDPPGTVGQVGYTDEARRDRSWVDFQHDVTVSDVDLAVRENLVSVEHVKRYTTVGMSIEQGKTSNLNALAVLAHRTNRMIPDVGTTSFRPPFVPVTLGAIAGGRNGRFYRPVRLLPAHLQHAALGASFEDYGGWQRPACYLKREDEAQSAAVQRELRALRTGVGVFDASPLGKILVRGPDAAEFLDHMYVNAMRTLTPGKVRYGLMLNERGVIIDDGVCARLSAEDFWVNTTGAGADRICAWFDEWLQGEWPHLQVVTTDVTSALATITITGPKARNVLGALPSDMDVSREAFPHMQARVGSLCGVPCRILRVSFTGELSYEISVPAEFGSSLWERICAVGQPFGIEPFGVESLLLARTEKGYLHVGADTDGNTVPADVGFGEAVAKKTGDFVGRRSLTLAEHLRPDRLQLVGLRCVGGTEAFNAGAHLLDRKLTRVPQDTAGYLTSACSSPTLEQHVGLGLLRNGRARLGETVYLVDGGKQSSAVVVSPTHYDPSGARLNV